jgi:hypothetical protein
MPFTEVALLDMPSGVKIRSRTKSSHDLPDTLATTWPAVMYMMFWYPKRERNDHDGARYRTRRTISSRSNPEPYQDSSPRASPLRWLSRSRTVISRLA